MLIVKSTFLHDPMIIQLAHKCIRHLIPSLVMHSHEVCRQAGLLGALGIVGIFSLV